MEETLKEKTLQLFRALLAELVCDRAVVACAGEGFTHGLAPGSIMTTAEISHGLLREAIERGEEGLLDDAVEDEALGNRTSVLLSQVRSVLFVPIRDAGGRMVGMVYADSRAQVAAFDDHELERAQEIVAESLIGSESELEAAVELDWNQLQGVHWN